MKVVHIVWSLKFGGIETMLTNIANAQVKAGAEICVMIINDNWDDELIHAFDDRVKLLYVHKKLGAGTPWFLIRMNKILKAEDPDVIHLHGCDIWSLIFSKKLSLRTCVTVHSVPKGEIRRSGAIFKRFPKLDITKRRTNVKNIDLISQVFAISEEVHDQLKERYGVESTVVSNGIPTESFICRDDHVPSVPFRIVQVSRLEHDIKGQDLLIQAAANLRGKLSVDFIGSGSSLGYLQQLVADLQIEEYVHFLGQKTQHEIKEHLADYDLFAQPSRFEGFGLTVAEAMAAGVPVLVTAGEGTAEVTCGDTYGWTFENGNADDLTDKIEMIIEDSGAALEKAAKARRYVVDTYDVSVTANKYLEEYTMDDSVERVKEKPVLGGGST